MVIYYFSLYLIFINKFCKSLKNFLLNDLFLKNKKVKTYNNIFGNPNQLFLSLPKIKNLNFTKQANFIELTCCDSLKKINTFLIIRILKEKNVYIYMQDSSFFKNIIINNLNIDWNLREINEFFGIKNVTLKDTRNLLLDYGFNTNPLLKKHNCMGYKEVFYDFFLEKPVYKKINNISL